jgi:hypothetical protein
MARVADVSTFARQAEWTIIGRSWTWLAPRVRVALCSQKAAVDDGQQWVDERHRRANRPAADSDRPKRDIGSYGMAVTYGDLPSVLTVRFVAGREDRLKALLNVACCVFCSQDQWGTKAHSVQFDNCKPARELPQKSGIHEKAL